MRSTDGLPIVAIVGRPNVGKSTLFNRIVGRRIALVHDEAGVTRDRNYARAEWGGRRFWIVDTGGLALGGSGGLEALVREQVEAAIEEADLVLFLIDASVGLTAEDEAIVRRLARLAKPALVAANKADDAARAMEAGAVVAASLGAAIPVSARSGRGVDALLDAAGARLPAAVAAPARDDDAVGVAIVGRPNVGKSSLVNAILGESKMIVSDVAGTTRDAVDTPLERDGRRFVLIDTAGLRKRARVRDGVEYWSTLRAARAIERCDVAAVVLDATQAIGEQDVKIAAEAAEMDKSVILVVNKWDAVEKDPEVAQRFEERRAWHFTFVKEAPLVYASAKTGRRVDRILPEAARLADLRARRVPTSELNELLARVVAENPPPDGRSGSHTRVLYGTQVEIRPPTIAVFTNRPEHVEGSYARYLRNRLAEELGLAGAGLKIVVRRREGKEAKRS
jgi:GTP-binding protein